MVDDKEGHSHNIGQWSHRKLNRVKIATMIKSIHYTKLTIAKSQNQVAILSS